MLFLLEGFQVRSDSTKAEELGFIREGFLGAQPEGESPGELGGELLWRTGRSQYFPVHNREKRFGRTEV